MRYMHFQHVGAAMAAGLPVALACVHSISGDRPAPALPRHAATAPPDELAQELDARLTRDVAPLLATYCTTCHSGDQPKGDVRLDTLASLHAALTHDLDLHLLRDMVASAAMPPKDKPHPSDHERLIITQWLDAALAYVPADAPIDPGWFTIHRLNRTEYRNTLRDLLGIDPAAHDLAAKLPRDDTGYGFDNIADVLSTSPLAIESYLAAAEQAVDLSLGPVVVCSHAPRQLGPFQGSTGSPLSRGYYLFAQGAATTKFDAPLTGEYLIRLRAWETPAGDEHSRLRVRLGARHITELEVTGTQDAPQEFEVRLRIPQGTHSLAFQFLNDYYAPGVADRNVAVEDVAIAGPLDEATTERPAPWRRIFDPADGAPDDDSAARAVLGAFASRAYRRPAQPEQINGLVRVYASQRAAGLPFEPAVRTALTAALVSPNFLFRTVAHPDAADPGARYTLDPYELASRLSYFLWSSMPDDALLAAAADASLLRDDVLLAQARRMLADPRSDAFVENFAGQWLQLRNLPSIAIDRQRFPAYTDQLRDDMTREATLFVADVLRAGRSVLEFIDSRETFLNQRLAELYAIPDVSGDEFRRVTLPEGSPRGGILTMGAVLTLTSNTTRTSPVKRGLFVLDQVLGAPPPPPPADIPPLEQAHTAGPDASVREQLAIHVANPTCAACHIRLDPLGLTFEHFDAIGRWRDTEQGRPVDATGTLPGGIALDGSADLKRNLLSRADQFVEALTSKTLTYALGRGVEPFDRPAIRQIARRTRAANDTFAALIESVVLSESFRTCRGRSPQP